MKIQCDVCGVEEASILCCADEAALCSGCDGRIHSANKLAGKHRRFSLLLQSSLPLPLCDICKRKNGFVFCQEDRAILCRDCDLPIHAANVHAGRHNRFLLTGIRLSSSPIPPSEHEVASQESPAERTAGGSNITDYLMKMLPGWRVDDFLFDDPAADQNDALKVNGTQAAASVPWFTPASANAAEELVAPPEMPWRPAMSFEEEAASMVPELSQFHCNHRISKRHRASLWF